MKAPLEWLKEFTTINVSTKDFAEKMTISGSKVEEVIVSGEEIQQVYTGKVISCEPHQNSDHLSICHVDLGKEELGRDLQIVCGAPNVVKGMICPVAIVGAKLPGGFSIKKGKIRGVESQGMCCSVQELGLSPAEIHGASEDGLWHMPDDTALGMDIKDYLGLGSVTIDFEITSNRPDCFSIEGLAREAAITLDEAFLPREPKVLAKSAESSTSFGSVEILAPELCYRYCAQVVLDVKIEPSPDWMQQRLRDAGMRPINNIVDITNYVCLELGQPMHAFDLNYLAGGQIVVRRAHKDETIRTLDGTERFLDTDMLVIADSEKPCALAGVMGGENSEVKEVTTSILFESATFDSVSVRRTATRNGLRTEASSRYEKGLDPENAYRALQRACELVELLGCGVVCPNPIDVYPTKLATTLIPFDAAKINSFLGTAIDETYMLSLFEKLGISLKNAAGEVICQIPSYRPDLLCQADLAEEVARFYGYNNITPTLFSGQAILNSGRSPEQKTIEKIKDVMIAQGFYEAITYSFESPKESDRLGLEEDDALRKQIVIANPLGEDFSVMRSSMMPSMLRIAATNHSRSVRKADIFEIAYVYLPSQVTGDLPLEQRQLAAFSYDLDVSYEKAESFYHLKGMVAELSTNLGIRNLRIEPTDRVAFLHPGRSAQIEINGRPCGFIGYVHPSVAETFEVPKGTVLLNIDAAILIQGASTKRNYKPLPKFPGISRDIAVILAENVSVGSIERIVRKQGGKYLESATLFDVYSGAQVEAGKKSVAYNLLFRSPERTLTDDDIKSAYEGILASLSQELGAKLR